MLQFGSVIFDNLFNEYRLFYGFADSPLEFISKYSNDRYLVVDCWRV